MSRKNRTRNEETAVNETKEDAMTNENLNELDENLDGLDELNEETATHEEKEDASMETTTTTTTTKTVTLEEALAKVKKLPGNFTVACSKCGIAKGVRNDVFEARVRKAYEVGSDLAGLMAGYLCQKCRKTSGLNFVGQKRTSSGGGKPVTMADLFTE